ncbi:MAG: ABC transporter ATP-binding protein [Candidatus Omnitrophota bacterium]|nr:ABC transporter ATP-binding protein [Candidatus Omnitrophota bacterium]
MKEYTRLIRFVLPHIWVLALAVVCMIGTSVFSGVSISMIIPLIDNIITGKKMAIPGGVFVPEQLKSLIDMVNAMPPMELLNKMVIIVMVFWLLRNVFEFFQSYFMSDVAQRVIRDVKNMIYAKLMKLPMEYYSKNPTGKLMSRITYDATVIRDSVATGLTDVLYQPIQFVVYLALVFAVKFYFSIPWSLILVGLILFPSIIYPVIKIGKRLKAISKQTQENMADITTTLHETISGMRVVKAFSMEDSESERFRKQNQQFYKLTMKSTKRVIVVSPITEFAGMFCIAVILWIAGKQIISGALSAGAFVTFLAALLSLMKPMKRLTNVYSINQQALAAASRIFEVLDTKDTVNEKPDAIEMPRFRDCVAFKDVHFAYDDKEILKGINLEVRRGEIAAFVGTSGAGKTTLVNLIPRFYDVTKGKITIDGIDIKDYSLKSLRSQISVVTQETILFNETVAYNISYGCKNPGKEDIVKAAEVANAHSFIMKMPNGYDTIIGERGFRLSGGEKQRLSIARAIFKNSPILILDEATSQLDTESEILVQEAIDRMMRNRTVFVIAHRLSTIKHATRIYVLDGGHIADVGPHDSLIQKDGLYKRLYDMQFGPAFIR